MVVLTNSQGPETSVSCLREKSTTEEEPTVQRPRAVRKGGCREAKSWVPGVRPGEQKMGAICGAGQGAGFVQKRTYSFLLPLQEGGLAVTIDSPCFYTLGLQEKKGLAQSHIAGGTWAGTDGSHPPARSW